MVCPSNRDLLAGTESGKISGHWGERHFSPIACVNSSNPQIVNNDEDAGLQTVIIGDIFSVFMIFI
jgi:hypothetical protein